MQKSSNLGFFYFYIHSKLRERAKCNLMSLEEARTFLFEWRLPKHGRIIVLRELELMGLIERINKNTIRLMPTDFPLNNVSRLYDMVGLIKEEMTNEQRTL